MDGFATRSRTLATDATASAATSLRRTEPAARPPCGAMSDALRHAIHEHARHAPQAQTASRHVEVGGLFGWAINAGIHDHLSQLRASLPAALSSELEQL